MLGISRIGSTFPRKRYLPTSNYPATPFKSGGGGLVLEAISAKRLFDRPVALPLRRSRHLRTEACQLALGAAVFIAVKASGVTGHLCRALR
jgi:hypothetical protein